MTTLVLVCGGRDYALGGKKADQQHMEAVLDQMRAHYGEIMVIHGGAPGADTWAGVWAERNGVHAAAVRALWPNYGKAAGSMRNSAMLLLRPAVCVAFPGGSGTANMVKRAQEAGVPTYEV